MPLTSSLNMHADDNIAPTISISSCSSEYETSQISTPIDVMCSLCEHHFQYPTVLECPMCGEVYSPPDASVQSEDSAPPQPADIPLDRNFEYLRNLEEELSMDKYVQQMCNTLKNEGTAKPSNETVATNSSDDKPRTVTCSKCNYMFEYPTKNFCGRCGHPASSSSSQSRSEVAKSQYNLGTNAKDNSTQTNNCPGTLFLFHIL